MFALSSLFFALLLLWITPVTSFTHPPSRTRIIRILPSTTECFSIREYVPLVVSSLVIIDVVCGQPFVKGIMSLAKTEEATEDNEPVTVQDLRPGIVDAEKMKLEALDLAENARGLRDWQEKRKGTKERIADTKERLERQYRELQEKEERR